MKSIALALSIAAFSLSVSMPATALAQSSGGDAGVGETVFKSCAGCHKVGAGAKNASGPVLNNIVGRKAGSFAGYRYGKGMKAAGAKGLIWDEAQLFNYIADPKKFLRAYLGDKKAKAKMRFKLKDANDRRNVIAYLASISSGNNTELEMAPKENTQIAAAALPSFAAGKDQVCIQNNFDKELLLTAESRTGERDVKTLAQNGVLCVSAGGSVGGMVGVFENEDALEGCSKLAKAGKTEVLIAYASFDNCEWRE